jgi:hypothetical protein
MPRPAAGLDQTRGRPVTGQPDRSRWAGAARCLDLARPRHLGSHYNQGILGVMPRLAWINTTRNTLKNPRNDIIDHFLCVIGQLKERYRNGCFMANFLHWRVSMLHVGGVILAVHENHSCKWISEGSKLIQLEAESFVLIRLVDISKYGSLIFFFYSPNPFPRLRAELCV